MNSFRELTSEVAGKRLAKPALAVVIVFSLRFGALFKKWSKNIFLRLDIEDLKP
jgi:hypothetical protein